MYDINVIMDIYDTVISTSLQSCTAPEWTTTTSDMNAEEVYAIGAASYLDIFHPN